MIEYPPRYYLIPGFSQTAGAWTAVADRLPAAAAVEMLDIPDGSDFGTTARVLGHGRSGIWAGYSLGGRLALMIALDLPQSVEALVLVSANPGIADPAAREERRLADEALADEVERVGAAAFLDQWLSQPLFAGLEGSRSRLHRRDSAAAIGAQLRMLGQGVQPSLWDRLGELQMPVVLVAGVDDGRYAAIAHAAADAIGSNARTAVIPGAGHALLQEQPATIAEILTSVAG